MDSSEKSLRRREGLNFIQSHNWQRELAASGDIWPVDAGRKKLAADQELDGRYPLATNAAYLETNEALTAFKGQDGVEKRFRTVKGPLLVRPLFVRSDQKRLKVWSSSFCWLCCCGRFWKEPVTLRD